MCVCVCVRIKFKKLRSVSFLPTYRVKWFFNNGNYAAAAAAATTCCWCWCCARSPFVYFRKIIGAETTTATAVRTAITEYIPRCNHKSIIKMVVGIKLTRGRTYFGFSLYTLFFERSTTTRVRCGKNRGFVV